MAKEKLTQTRCKKLKTKGLYNDGGGLCLQVGEGGGAKSWIYRYAVGGRERHMGLGGFDTFNIEEARELARQARQLRVQGIDPIEHRKAQRHARAEAERQAAEKNQTFRQVAETYLATRNWRPGTLAQASHKFPKYIYPKLGDVPISSIDVGHLEGLFRPILDKGLGATASQIHMFVSAILEYAGRSGGDNPARLKGQLGRRLPHLVDARAGKGARGNPYLDYKRIGEFMAALRAFRYQHWASKTPIPARALEFLILTAVRIDQVTSLPWNEIDWEEKLWVCPPERHKVGGKTNMDYIVPLSDQAMRTLEEMRKLQQDCGLYSERGFVFVHGPSTDVHGRPVNRRAAGNPINRMSPRAFLKEASGDHGWKDKDGKRISPADGWRAKDGREITPHGFRTSFGDWSVEHGYEERDSEIALGHTVGNQMRNRYKREAHRIEPRRLMMQAWADYCDRTEPVGGANVVQMRTAK